MSEGLDMKSLIETTKAWLLPTRPEYEPPPLRRAYLIAAYTVHRWLVIDRCSPLASSLALQTLLSVVPIAGVFLFFIHLLDPTVGQDFLAQIVRTLSPNVARAEEIATTIIELGENVSIRQLGLWGFLGVVVLAYFLFSTLERTLNGIWRVNKQRQVWAKFTIFYTLATLGPIVMVYSLAQPLLAQVTRWLLSPVITTTVGLVLINRLLPFQRVKWRAAFAGALLSASLFEVGKLGFGRYLSMVALDTYDGVYGTGLAILPVFVIWSYVSWLIVLLGAELAFVVHHLSAIHKQGYVHPSNRAALIQAAPGRTAARLLLAIADNYTHHDVGTTVDEIEDRYRIGLGSIAALTDQLEEAGLIATLADGGYVPARPLDQIRLQEVLHMFDGGDLDLAREDALGDVFAGLDDAQGEQIGELTIAELVKREATRRDETSRPRLLERP